MLLNFGQNDFNMKNIFNKLVTSAGDYIDSDVKVYLTLSVNPDKMYEIQEFDLSFSQPTDHKGQPQSETNGGVIDFAIDQLPDEIINKWMMNSTMMLSGEFSFERSMQSAVLKVKFTDSYCVGCDKSVGVGGVITRLRISPEEVDINGKGKLKIWAS